jgi:hypothetical protein
MSNCTQGSGQDGHHTESSSPGSMGLDVMLATLVPALLLSAFTIGLVARSEREQLSSDRPDGLSEARRQQH